jgi:porphobilinogen synthase
MYPITDFPTIRMRRLRQKGFLRNLVREHALKPADLILPVFITDRPSGDEVIPSMPGVSRLSENSLFVKAEEALNLGIPALALFPVIESGKKTLTADEACHPEGLVQRRVRELKNGFLS